MRSAAKLIVSSQAPNHRFVDASAWPPLLRLTFPPINTAESTRELFEELYRWQCEVSVPYAWISDATYLKGADAVQRRILADHFRRIRDLPSLKREIAHVLVIPSPVVRGILTAVEWVSPAPTRLSLFAARAEAEAFMAETLRKRQEQSG